MPRTYLLETGSCYIDVDNFPQGPPWQLCCVTSRQWSHVDSIGAMVCTIVCMHVHANMFMHITADNACLQGETALYPAVIKGRYDMVVLLLAQGADVSPSSEGTVKVVSSLIQHNCQLALALKNNHMFAQGCCFLSLIALCISAHCAPSHCAYQMHCRFPSLVVPATDTACCRQVRMFHPCMYFILPRLGWLPL